MSHQRMRKMKALCTVMLSVLFLNFLGHFEAQSQPLKAQTELGKSLSDLYHTLVPEQNDGRRLIYSMDANRPEFRLYAAYLGILDPDAYHQERAEGVDDVDFMIQDEPSETEHVLLEVLNPVALTEDQRFALRESLQTAGYRGRRIRIFAKGELSNESLIGALLKSDEAHPFKDLAQSEAKLMKGLEGLGSEAKTKAQALFLQTKTALLSALVEAQTKGTGLEVEKKISELFQSDVGQSVLNGSEQAKEHLKEWGAWFQDYIHAMSLEDRATQKEQAQVTQDLGHQLFPDIDWSSIGLGIKDKAKDLWDSFKQSLSGLLTSNE